MSERTHYPPGVPCWVDTLQPDPEAATRFYADLFGWQFVGPGPMPGAGKYFVGRLRGRDIAGVSSQPPEGAPPSAVWNTYVAVANVDDTSAKVTSAGGMVVAAPFDALPAGRMAVIQDSGGATFSIWEAKNRNGAQLVNEPSAWAMSTLVTQDPDRSKSFYGDVFGWETETFQAGPAQITLWRLPGYVGGEPLQPVPRDVIGVMIPADAPPHWSVDFWIDDVDAAVARATVEGATIVAPPHDVPGFRHAILADPQGAIFSLSQLKLSA
jgi:predicted enzyme related to lactoylglutathione lyase